MGRFVEGEEGRQAALLPSCRDDHVGEDNAARVIDNRPGEPAPEGAAEWTE
jgi:hypothetical protein